MTFHTATISTASRRFIGVGWSASHARVNLRSVYADWRQQHGASNHPTYEDLAEWGSPVMGTAELNASDMPGCVVEIGDAV